MDIFICEDAISYIFNFKSKCIKIKTLAIIIILQEISNSRTESRVQRRKCMSYIKLFQQCEMWILTHENCVDWAPDDQPHESSCNQYQAIEYPVETLINIEYSCNQMNGVEPRTFTYLW